MNVQCALCRLAGKFSEEEGEGGEVLADEVPLVTEEGNSLVRN